MDTAWLQDSGWDLGALLFHVTAFLTYRAVQRLRGRRDPAATLQSQQAALRAQWVGEILGANNGILGVQTLRNAMSGVLFFASNTIFLVLGTLTLTANRDLRQTWGLLDPGAHSPHLGQLKLVILLFTLLIAFFCFINAIRLFSHASLSIATRAATAEHVTGQINDAWRYQGLGVRCYYFAAPILFWLFGAPWFLLASLGVLVLMQIFDSPSTRR